MKKIKIIAAAFLSCVSMVGCTKFLDTPPATILTDENFYNTPADFYAALIATYKSLTDNGIYSESIYLFGDVRSDVATPIQPNSYLNNYRREIETFSMSSLNSANQNYWADHYRGIIRSNIVIDRGGEMFGDNPTVKRYIAEAQVLRAFFYFNLVRAYGGVPVVLNVPDKYADSREHVRASAESIYIQIIKDLQEAIESGYLYRSNDRTKAPTGRVDKYVAEALLGKVFLSLPDAVTAAAYPNVPAWSDVTRSPRIALMYPNGATTKYEAARYYLSDVIKNGGYSLMANFSDLFKPANKHNTESLWEAEYMSNLPDSLGSPFYTSFCTTNYAPGGDPKPNTNGFTPAALATIGKGNCVPTGYFMDFAKKWDSMYPDYSNEVRKFNGQVYSDRRISDGKCVTDNAGALKPVNDNKDYPQSPDYPYDPYTGTTFIVTVKGFGDDGKRMCGKYMSPSPSFNNDSDDNWYILRYADVLLVEAEAEAHISGGVLSQTALDNTINMVRARAGIVPYTSSGNTSDSWVLDTPAKTYQAIFDERMLEFAFEGQRWFDLTRSGQAVYVMNKHFTDFYNAYTSNSSSGTDQYYMKDTKYQIDEYCTVFPIPTQEVLVNVHLDQNFRAR